MRRLVIAVAGSLAFGYACSNSSTPGTPAGTGAASSGASGGSAPSSRGGSHSNGGTGATTSAGDGTTDGASGAHDAPSGDGPAPSDDGHSSSGHAGKGSSNGAGGSAPVNGGSDGGAKDAAGGADEAASGSGAVETSGGHGGSGGHAGSGAAGGRGGVAGSGGAAGSATAGTGGASGAGTSGAGGTGGTVIVTNACTTCGSEQCTTTWNRCTDSAECAPWLGCVAACTTSACADACDAAYPAVARYAYKLYACICASCTSDCTSLAACGRTCTDDLNLPLLNKEPATLADTGLYTSADASADAIAPYVSTYTPRYTLWSDGAEKRRFVYIPRCSRIDATDMDHWEFPVGTRFWKEFRVPESGNVLVETRFIHRYGPGPNDWIFAAYQWDPNVATPHASDAHYLTTGVTDANGTDHDIPAPDDCTRCHTHLPERAIGFGAIELSHSLPGVTIRSLSDEGWLDPPAASGFSPPGDATAQAALGYVHTNCGGCHNPSFDVGGSTPPHMRLSVNDMTVEDTGFYTTLLGVPTYNSDFAGILRVAPCDPSNSEIIMRMSSRPVDQMPPFGTEKPDPNGIATVSAFIDELAEPGQTCGP